MTRIPPGVPYVKIKDVELASAVRNFMITHEIPSLETTTFGEAALGERSFVEGLAQTDVTIEVGECGLVDVLKDNMINGVPVAFSAGEDHGFADEIRFADRTRSRCGGCGGSLFHQFMCLYCGRINDENCRYCGAPDIGAVTCGYCAHLWPDRENYHRSGWHQSRLEGNFYVRSITKHVSQYAPPGATIEMVGSGPITLELS